MSVKYAKFDSFLKRMLTNKEYKEVKTYEPCVVISSKEKHSFRFTFVTKDRIYITENPPKTLLYAVNLKDVIDIYVVNDKAYFLQADLRDHVQHVVVQHIGGVLDSSPSRPSTAKSVDQPFSPVHSAALGQSQTISNGLSTSVERSTPLLCSYTALDTVEESRTQSEQANGSKPPTLWGILKTAKTFKSKMARTEVRRSAYWELKDPYSIHVLQPDSQDSSPPNIEELHLYILDENTTFLLLLKAVWRNYIIYHSFPCRKSALYTNDVHSTLHIHDSEELSPEKSVSMDENTRTLFADLKQELLFVKNIEHLYSLYNELKTATAHDILIKSLFWKDDILFKKSIELIGRNIKQSVTVDIDDRADEIELAILILQTVAIMLRETEAIPQCYRVLQNLTLPFFKDIVDTLLSSPRLLCDSWSCNEDISALLKECTLASCEVLYEFIISTKQMSWVVNGKSPAYTTALLFAAIDENANLPNFLENLIRSCIDIWDPREAKSTKLSRRLGVLGGKPFNVEDAVKTFHLFTVFHRIIVGSPSAAQHVRATFQEEFKYYINPGSVSEKFPSTYPISGMARSVIHAVGSFVTGGPSNVK